MAQNAQSERQATAMRQAQHRAKLVHVKVLKQQHQHVEAIGLCRMLLSESLRAAKPNADAENFLEATTELGESLLRWTGRFSRADLDEACALAKGCFEHCQVHLGRGATCAPSTWRATWASFSRRWGTGTGAGQAAEATDPRAQEPAAQPSSGGGPGLTADTASRRRGTSSRRRWTCVGTSSRGARRSLAGVVARSYFLLPVPLVFRRLSMR